MMRIFPVLLILFSTSFLMARNKYAVVRMCFEKDGKPFTVVKEEKPEGTLEYVENKKHDKFILKMQITIDGEPTTAYRPQNESCLMLYKVPEGYHSIAVDLHNSQYTFYRIEDVYERRFKKALLYKTEMNVIEGSVADIEIEQTQNKVSLFQSLDNKSVENCEKSCSVPVGIPVYFKIKPEDEKVLCPVDYQMVFSNEKETSLSCYNRERITKMLREHVSENSIRCKVDVEYAYFTVFGDGCIVTLKSDEYGLNPEDPEIKLLPLEKQRVKYYVKVNDGEKELYKFTGDRTGQRITPEKGDKIIFTEERAK